jgi:eukaryotic-like serine/threonine-protein kinase
MWMVNTSGAVHSTPTVSSTTVFIGCDDSYLYALNVINGSLLWKFKTGASIFQASPALSNNMVFIGSGDSVVYALSADTGELLWSRSVIGNLQMSSPVIGGDGSLYLTTYSSRLLLSINSMTGNIYWSNSLNGDASSLAIGADGRYIS